MARQTDASPAAVESSVGKPSASDDAAFAGKPMSGGMEMSAEMSATPSEMRGSMGPGGVAVESPRTTAPAGADMMIDGSAAIEEGVGDRGGDMMEWPTEPDGPMPDSQRNTSGRLTAGTIDDVTGWHEFRDFLQETMQNDPEETYPRVAVGEPFMIRVRDGQQRPIQDARVVVRVNGNIIVDRRTGSDGQVLLTSAMDQLPAEFAVAVAAQNETATETCNRDDVYCTIVMEQCQGESPQRLDLGLVIDTTGSMGDELSYLKAEIRTIAATIKKMFPNVDQRFALIVYRDNGDQYVTRMMDFTGNLAKFQGNLASQVAAGGGDYPEAMHVAMEQANSLQWRDEGTARMLFVVGDAPPHDEHSDRTLTAGKKLREQGVRVFPVGASGVAKKAEYIMRSLAFMTQGQYLFLTDHSGIGNAHAAPHVSEYIVEHLDRAMIRMIASELAGKHLAPTEVLAIESGQRDIDWSQEQPFVQQTSYQGPLMANQQPIYARCGTVAKPSWAEQSWSFAKEHAIWMLLANLCVGLSGVYYVFSNRRPLQSPPVREVSCPTKDQY